MRKKHGILTVKILMAFAMVFTLSLVSGIQSKAAPARPAQVTGVKQTGAYDNAFGIEWNDASGAEGYLVYASTSASGSYQLVGDAYDFTYDSIWDTDMPGMKAGSTYYVKVVAYVEYYDDASSSYKYVFGTASSPFQVVTAPSGKTTAIKHTGSSENAIALDWASVSGANCYAVQIAKSEGGQTITKHTSKSEYVYKNLSKNKEYTVRVTAARRSESGFMAYAESGTYKYNIPLKPTKATKVKAQQYQDSSQIYVECQRNEAADGYQFQIYDVSSGKAQRVITTSTSGGSYDNYKYVKKSQLKYKHFYAVRARAWSKVNGSSKKLAIGNWSNFTYVCQQPDMKMRESSSGVKIAWDQIKGADCYKVYMSTKQKSGYKKLTTTTKNSTFISKSKLKSGKTYYFYVVAQKKAGGTYYSGNTGRWVYYMTY